MPRISGTLVRALHTSTSASASASAAPRVTRTAAAAKATIQPSQQSASLGSVVLFSTKRQWRNETVTTLKAELKRRGLSQVGNKAALVSRLRDAEAPASLVPQTPSAAPKSGPSPRPRSVSTSAPTKAKATPDAVHPTPAIRGAPPSPDLVVTASGDKHVESGHVANPKPLTPSSRVSAPGLPIQPNTVAQAFFDVKFPDPTPIRQIPQIIPTVPDNFTVTKRAAPVLKQGPRVVTVASAATHPAGGPVSPAQPVTDSYALEWDDVSALQLESAAVSAAAAAAAAVSDLVEINLPPAVNEREAKYIADSSPLTEHERNGAWLLAGGIAGVFLVGGIASKKSHEKNHKKVEDKKADDKKD